MLAAIKHALANLTNPNGRDGRQTFWYWVLALFLVRFAVSMVFTIPMMGRMMSGMMKVAPIGEKADEAAMQAKMAELLAAEMHQLVWFGVAVGIVSMALIATSLVRRLHDSDMSGWWILLPGGIQAFLLARAPAQIDAALEMMKSIKPGQAPNPAMFMASQGLTALLGYASLGLLIWFGVRKSSEGPNRFGDAPTRL